MGGPLCLLLSSPCSLCSSSLCGIQVPLGGGELPMFGFCSLMFRKYSCTWPLSRKPGVRSLVADSRCSSLQPCAPVAESSDSSGTLTLAKLLLKLWFLQLGKWESLYSIWIKRDKICPVCKHPVPGTSQPILDVAIELSCRLPSVTFHEPGSVGQL